jgi:hypothetical protein
MPGVLPVAGVGTFLARSTAMDNFTLLAGLVAVVACGFLGAFALEWVLDEGLADEDETMGGWN